MNEALRDELLLELTTTDYWRAFKAYLTTWSVALGDKVTQPATSLMGLVEKEAVSAQLALLNRLVKDIENRADRTAKKERA